MTGWAVVAGVLVVVSFAVAPVRVSDVTQLLAAQTPRCATRWRRLARSESPMGTEVLTMLGAIMAALRSGLPTDRAILVSGRHTPGTAPAWVRDLMVAAERTEPLARVWRTHAESTGDRSLRVVAAVWELSERHGVPLVDGVVVAADLARAERARARAVAAAAAGPRASATVLSWLPVAGPVAGLAIGVSPVALYGNVFGLISAVAGLVLLLLGRWWTARMIASATSPHTGADVTRDDVATAAVLVSLALRGGAALGQALRRVADVLRPQVADELRQVAAAWEWGVHGSQAWQGLSSHWAPVRHALAVAADAGASPVDALRHVSDELRRDEEERSAQTVARLGVRLVIPLGLAFLPAFFFTTVVPIVVVIAGQFIGVLS